MKLLLTPDIPQSVREDLRHAWQPLGGLELTLVEFHLAAEPTSFIQIMGEAIQWLSPLKVAVTVFLSQLAKEAATDAYKNKKRIREALTNAATAPLAHAVAALSRARENSPSYPGIVLGLSTPDEICGPALSITVDSEERMASLLARFISRAEKIEQIVHAEISAGRPPRGRVEVLPTDAGGFILRWTDQRFESHAREVT